MHATRDLARGSTPTPAPAEQPTAPGAAAAPTPQPRPRDDAIDLLRGAVMVLMALDHVRDFFGNAAVDPTDLARTTPALFATRWVTHFCAPVFVFLAGAAAYLSGARGRPRVELARFLLTRGLWLVVLELTVVRFGWLFDLSYRFTFVQVIWAIGWSMVALAALVFLPARVVGVVGVAMIVGHNALDGVRAANLGAARGLWTVLHEPAMLYPVPGARVFVAYPLVPWIGVMAAGYGFGPWLARGPDARRRAVAGLGAAMVVAFVVLRAANVYGDPEPWAAQPGALRTAMAFVNCTKYPPSLLYLLMTLGPALVVLAWLDRARGPVARAAVVFGRVPLFYYVLHLPLIHALAGVVALARYGPGVFHAASPLLRTGLRLPLPWVYLVWVAVVAALYPACRWFAGVKARRRDPWLGYM